MTVQELIDKLQKVDNKKIEVICKYSYTVPNTGCDTCGYGAQEEEKDVSIKEASDLETRFVIDLESY